ncbi:MAG: hypothetical protein ACLQU1_42535 [Bryobacteraceae bacterium]
MSERHRLEAILIGNAAAALQGAPWPPAGMDAAPELARIAASLERHGLEAILIGNAAAALQGAPVTTST